MGKDVKDEPKQKESRNGNMNGRTYWVQGENQGRNSQYDKQH